MLCTKFEVIGPPKTELRAKEVGEFSAMLNGKWAGGLSSRGASAISSICVVVVVLLRVEESSSRDQ